MSGSSIIAQIFTFLKHGIDHLHRFSVVLNSLLGEPLVTVEVINFTTGASVYISSLLLSSSTESICKKFESRSGPTKCRA